MSGCGCGGAKCRLVAGDPRHGTANGYGNRGCRCSPCLEAGKVRNCKSDRTRTPEQWRAANRAAYRRDPERHNARKREWRSQNAEAERERLRRWHATPEGRASRRARRRRRREREHAVYCGCDNFENLAAVWALDEGRCAYCNAPGTDIEHVIPVARGGWGCVANFRVACGHCNTRKGTKPLPVFLAQLAASGVSVRPGATNSGLPCPEAAYRAARRALPASPRSVTVTALPEGATS